MSHRTAHFQTNNLVKKLNAANSRKVVAVSMESGIV
jgi:hypothetical protein